MRLCVAVMVWISFDEQFTVDIVVAEVWVTSDDLLDVFELEGMRGGGGEAGPGLLRSKGRTVFLEKANFLAQVQMKIRG